MDVLVICSVARFLCHNTASCYS